MQEQYMFHIDMKFYSYIFNTCFALYQSKSDISQTFESMCIMNELILSLLWVSMRFEFWRSLCNKRPPASHVGRKRQVNETGGLRLGELVD